MPSSALNRFTTGDETKILSVENVLSAFQKVIDAYINDEIIKNLDLTGKSFDEVGSVTDRKISEAKSRSVPGLVGIQTGVGRITTRMKQLLDRTQLERDGISDRLKKLKSSFIAFGDREKSDQTEILDLTHKIESDIVRAKSQIVAKGRQRETTNDYYFL